MDYQVTIKVWALIAKKDYILLFIDYRNFINIVIKLDKYGVETWSFIAKQKDKNDTIVLKEDNVYNCTSSLRCSA